MDNNNKNVNNQHTPAGKQQETTEIPPFLRGSSEPSSSDVERTLEMDRIDLEPEETIPVQHERKPEVKKQHPHKKEKMPNSVRALSVLVVVALIGYIALNIYWSIFGVSVRKQTAKATATPAAAETAQPSETASSVSDSGELGTLTVDIDAITIRSEPSVSAEELGTVYAGESYSVYGTHDADGYTWYEIDQSGQWIASDGSWVTYLQN